MASITIPPRDSIPGTALVSTANTPPMVSCIIRKIYLRPTKNLPLPSYLRVTNLDNGRRLIVRVNDRGPFHGDKFSISHGAASRLRIVGAGTAKGAG